MSNIYSIKRRTDGAVVALVRADTKTGALRHIAEATYTAGKAEQDDLVAALQSGMPIQEPAQSTEPVTAAE